MRRPRLRDDKGAVAVEAAIILPVLCLLVFGIIEFGMLFRANITVSQSARAGARTAVALPKYTGYQTSAANAVAAQLRNTLGSDEIQYLTIYKADKVTGRPVGGAGYKTCTTTCYRFTWNPSTNAWVPVAGTAWLPSAQNACGKTESDTDYLGVYVESRYTWKTGLFNPIFGNTTTIAERTVMRLEPLGTLDNCLATP
jgi:Flp pilus assembly protein TadG